MHRAYSKWYSPVLGRDMELLSFGYAGTPVLFFPTRTARFYDYENWRIIEALSDKINAGILHVFCLDSIDLESFYSDKHPAQRIERHLQYESYVLNEVIPFIRSNNSSRELISAGCSLGGYHAVNIAFKYPQFFTKVVGLSARYDLTHSSDRFPDLLDGYIDEQVYYNMPSMFLPNLSDENILKRLRKLKVVIVIGKEDPFYANNLHLEQTLISKKIIPEFYVWDEEAHRPRYWRQMVQIYL